MKVTYCGCKSVMKTQLTNFPRGKTIEVSEKVGTEVLKINGFYLTMNADAKKELKANEDREALEVKKLESGAVTVITVPADELKEIKVLGEALEESSEQLSIAMGENETLSEQLGEAEAKIQDLEKQLLAEQAKSLDIPAPAVAKKGK